jgi:hypothetical protein
MKKTPVEISAGGNYFLFSALQHLSPNFTHHPVESEFAFSQAMTPGFIPDTIQQDFPQVVQRSAGPQGGEQVYFMLTQQTGTQETVGSETRPCAGSAKWHGYRRNETYFALRPRNMEQARFSIQFAAIRNFQRTESLFDTRLYFRLGNSLAYL